MRITESPMDFHDYYQDPRFARKIPRLNQDWRERCGDNIYYRNDAGEWVQDQRACYHTTQSNFLQDTHYPRVFISNYYFYFGEPAPIPPENFSALLKIGRGCVSHEGEEVRSFIAWLEQT
jgi:hypothetical protein